MLISMTSDDIMSFKKAHAHVLDNHLEFFLVSPPIQQSTGSL